MPLSGTTYVNPGWRDGGPPALSAAELNAISDTLAAAQAKNISQDSLIAALQTAVSAGAKIELGSYIGTGTYGASNPNSITFSFAPKLVWLYAIDQAPKPGKPVSRIYSDVQSTTSSSYTCKSRQLMSELTPSYTQYNGFIDTSYSSGSRAYAKKSSDGKTLYWYNLADYVQQMNSADEIYSYTYYWVAFG